MIEEILKLIHSDSQVRCFDDLSIFAKIFPSFNVNIRNNF